MPETEKTRPECIILPMQDFRAGDTPRGKAGKKSGNKSGGKTRTTMAALLAVSISHDKSISAEEHLIRIIESSGEVEVLDTDDALVDMGFDTGELGIGGKDKNPTEPVNDNAPVSVISGR